MSRERLIPIIIVTAAFLDWAFPIAQPGTLTGAWLVPAIMGAGALIGALKGRRQEKNASEASRYQAAVQAERDRYEAALSRAKRGERLRFGNALARSRGFVIPEFDPSASEGVTLNQPPIPKYKSGGFLELLGAGASGLAEGMNVEAERAARYDRLPDIGTEDSPSSQQPQGASSYTPFDPGFSLEGSSAPSSDPYSSVLGRTDYFGGGGTSRYRSNLSGRG